MNGSKMPKAPAKILIDSDKAAIRKRLGIPDWRDASSYPSPRDFTLNEWRWEFLRRNDKYQEDFERPESSYEKESKERFFERAYLLVNIVDPRRSVRDIKQAVPALDGVFPPSFDADVQFLDYESRYLYAVGHQVVDRLLQDATASHLFLRVDLRRPLRPQFRKLLEIAHDGQRSWRTKTRRPRKSNWTTYLRALDARTVGESYSVIAKSLLRHTDKTPQAARDVVHQAAALCKDWPY